MTVSPYPFTMKDVALAARVGHEVRRLREAAGLSQEAFADRCGLHRTYIGSVERAEKTVTVETAKKIVAALGVSLGQFFTGIDE